MGAIKGAKMPQVTSKNMIIPGMTGHRRRNLQTLLIPENILSAPFGGDRESIAFSIYNLILGSITPYRTSATKLKKI